MKTLSDFLGTDFTLETLVELTRLTLGLATMCVIAWSLGAVYGYGCIVSTLQ